MEKNRLLPPKVRKVPNIAIILNYDVDSDEGAASGNEKDKTESRQEQQIPNATTEGTQALDPGRIQIIMIKTTTQRISPEKFI